MKLLVMLICSAVLLLILEKPLKKYTAVFYCAAMFLAVTGYVLQIKLPAGIIRTIVSDYLTSGTLPAALFVIVMYARVLPVKSRTFRCAMSLRGEIAILAAIFGLTHIVYYGHFTGKRMGAMQGISVTELVTLTVAALLILLLVPLTITSFKRIRKKINGKRWKKLQRWSYLFYGLLYLHIAIALYPGAVSGDRRKLADISCYTVIFGIYLALRVGKYLEKKKKQEFSTAVWTLLVVFLMAVSFSFNSRMVMKIEAEERETDTSEKESAENASEDNMDSAGGYADGTWEGEGMGLNGPVRAAVVVEEGEIKEVKILERSDDDPYFTDARQVIVSEILEQQTADVDGVSGATFSSDGILEAVSKALAFAAEKK